ncbi:hypothetical protein PCANC_27359 [Puccinia coronata f. sp. avenae]|uniref:Uncharacterized protein n=1 Tax=Puccinia coronata f. sp. avenae TaxID=200324 RepID=A0A2N5SCW1_9BASI|nr:hypothetical protein PCANC_27359 [Puccinia coronata f. sp. avenae]
MADSNQQSSSNTPHTICTPWLTTQTGIPNPGDRSRSTHSQSRKPSANNNFLRLIMETQHQGMLQAQADRAAAAAQIARLEDAILLLSIKSEETPNALASPGPSPGRINLQRFCIAVW